MGRIIYGSLWESLWSMFFSSLLKGLFFVPRLSVLVRDQTIRPLFFFMMTLLPSTVFLILEEPWFLGNTQTTNHSKVEIWNLKIWNIQKTIQSFNLFNTYLSPPTTHAWSPNKPPPWRQMVEVHLGEEGCRVFFWHFLAAQDVVFGWVTCCDHLGMSWDVWSFIGRIWKNRMNYSGFFRAVETYHFFFELWSSWIGSLYNRKRQLQIHKW